MNTVPVEPTLLTPAPTLAAPVRFDHVTKDFGGGVLGLDDVTSSAWEDNAASRRVSEKVGYRETGRGQGERRGVPTGEVFFELRPGGFVRGNELVRITGADELRRFLGLG